MTVHYHFKQALLVCMYTDTLEIIQMWYISNVSTFSEWLGAGIVICLYRSEAYGTSKTFVKL